MTFMTTLVRRDLRLFAARGGEGVLVVFFFLMVASLFPLALGAEKDLLAASGPGVLWVCALLASLLSLERLYHRDYDDSTFDMLLMAPLSAFGIALSKSIAHWIVAGLPLCFAAVFAAQMFFIPASHLGVILPSLLLGTIYMSLLGGFGAFLTLGARRPGLLLGLIVLPLYIPMLLLGVMAAEALVAGTSPKSWLLLQAALTVAGFPLSLLASAGLLKMHLRSN